MNQTTQPIIESFPRQIAEINDLLKQIQKKVHLIKQNKKDKSVYQKHEEEAQQIYQELVNRADISLVYNYLLAIGGDKDAFRTFWQTNLPSVENQEWLAFVQNYPLDLTILPLGSFYIQFQFKLLKPYVSRDDNPFYIIDNPIVREKVFRWPMVRSTAWKGSLRHALWQMGYQTENEQIKRLFGTANDEDEQCGCLYFYPSFFTQTSLEIINPHDRERRVGKNPILIESVPIGSTATFTVLYVPLYHREKSKSSSLIDDIFIDIELVASGLQAMFTTYGFGAKTSSGFGLADANQGSFVLNLPDQTTSQRPSHPIKPQTPVKPEIMQTYLANFPHEDFALKPDEWRKKHNATNSQRETYKKDRAAHSEYQQQLANWEKDVNALPSPQTQRTFTSLETLTKQVIAIAQNGGR